MGFLTVRKQADYGYIGGLLVVDCHARPIEFHCSLPLKPSRAQTILYGPTLDDFVCGEQIARALVLKSKSKPNVLLTDTTAVLSLRNIISEPMAWVATESEETSSLNHRPSGKNTCDQLVRFQLDRCELGVSEGFTDDIESIERFWNEFEPQLDLDEPFGRILEALLEANPSAKAA